MASSVARGFVLASSGEPLRRPPGVFCSATGSGRDGSSLFKPLRTQSLPRLLAPGGASSELAGVCSFGAGSRNSPPPPSASISSETVVCAWPVREVRLQLCGIALLLPRPADLGPCRRSTATSLAWLEFLPATGESVRFAGPISRLNYLPPSAGRRQGASHPRDAVADRIGRRRRPEPQLPSLSLSNGGAEFLGRVVKLFLGNVASRMTAASPIDGSRSNANVRFKFTPCPAISSSGQGRLAARFSFSLGEPIHGARRGECR